MTTMRLRPDLEDALRALPGVQAVSVVTSALGVPTEVHVLASPGKSPKQVVRDVQSMAMTAFEMDIDRRIVSVVQIGQQEGAPTAVLVTPSGPDTNEVDALEAMTDGSASVIRPIVQRISLTSTRTSSSANVVIRMGSDEFTGEVTGAGSAAARAWVVAEAAVQAVSELIGTGCEVESAQVVASGSREVAVVVLVLQVPRVGEHVLTGSALVRTYADDAVVRAVLDALNRHLTG
ncbi:hypothetical protein ACPPVT_15750 [Angustibacter sp. McL0619]|uniref:hypothetical protein n=1 Tax=Angustibacter sp. McL0619 TaxID=3415676 RepID=UPI003CF4902D